MALSLRRRGLVLLSEKILFYSNSEIDKGMKQCNFCVAVTVGVKRYLSFSIVSSNRLSVVQ
jgi:hypothetical protein